ncbi:MAG: CPBP family glutamic-type intramembrane protease [Bacteroidales bacterium]|nr:CPBP family glutamic-type intramembrane protease [Bacteroidales bacterium]
MSEKLGANAALVVTTLVYGLVHIWSFNFMLVMAALVAGGVWGLIYRIKPALLPALIISHALWDALVFVILPI